MASLDDLSTETLQTIFSYFCLHCHPEQHSTAADAYFSGTQQKENEQSWYSLDRHALFNLCLVSKRFREIAQTVLYHEFVLGYGDSWRSGLYTWDGRLTSFMRTVSQRPELAALVKSVYIHPYLLKPVGEEETRDALEQAAHALNIDPWQHQLVGDLVTVLIAQLPNLEWLGLQRGPGPLRSIRLSDLMGDDIPRLPIKTINITKQSSSGNNLFIMDPNALSILEMAEDLETLNLHMCRGVCEGIMPFLPKLKTLRLTYSRLGHKDLKRLLSSCANLHTFIYEATESPGLVRSYNDGRDHFHPSLVTWALMQHRTTLKELYLDLRARGWSPSVEGKRIQPRLSFKRLSALEHLYLNMDELYSSNWKDTHLDSRRLVTLLPRSIVSLQLDGHIGEEFPRVVEGLRALAKAALRGRFPQLGWVVCKKEPGLETDDLRDSFEAAGIKFEYESLKWPMIETTVPSDLTPSSEPVLQEDNHVDDRSMSWFNQIRNATSATFQWLLPNTITPR